MVNVDTLVMDALRRGVEARASAVDLDFRRSLVEGARVQVDAGLPEDTRERLAGLAFAVGVLAVDLDLEGER